jgi:hypothetical protein
MNSLPIRFVCGAGFVVLAVSISIGSGADDPKTPPAAKTGAVNVMWRFDGTGRFPNIRPPSEWQRDKNVLWKTPVEIGGYSSPIVAGNRVFVSAEMGSLICLDLADG